MKTKGKVVGLVTAIFVLAAFLPGGAVGAEDVTIGVLYAYSGDLGIYGEPRTDAMKLAVKEVNENGGVLGRRLKLVIMDTETSEVVAVKKAHELVDVDWYNVPVIIGTTGSGPCMAIIDYTTSNDVLQISPSVTGVEFTTYPDNDLFFRTCPSDELQGIAMARLAIKQGYTTGKHAGSVEPLRCRFRRGIHEEIQSSRRKGIGIGEIRPRHNHIRFGSRESSSRES